MTDLPVIVLPRPPEPAAAYRFPVVASTAPIVVSVVLWLVTKSPFALVFAALGPVTALAGYIDSRWSRGRSTRRDAARYRDQRDAARNRIAAAHDLERSLREEATPDASVIAVRRGADHARWMRGPDEPLTVSLGRGTTVSDVRCEGDAADPDLAQLVAGARELADAPLSVDARLGIGVCGMGPAVDSWARGLVLQLAWSLDPGAYWVAFAADSADHEWLSALPHAAGPLAPTAWVEFGRRGSPTPVASIARSTAPAELPGSCRVVVSVGGGAVVITAHPDRLMRREVDPTFVSREQALGWAVDASLDAARHGITPRQALLPNALDLASLPLGPASNARTTGAPASLACAIGRDADGTVELDLVRHGPHAVVGGTTGSGKSELLITWVIAMASSYPPGAVNFLLVDFKGGSAFDSLGVLPHTVGTITDLDGESARRALESLRAEVAYRERTLAGIGARSIDDCDTLARLVIVVDEFATMVAEHPDLHSVFADLAARGRSLGIHLVLCTQRPAGIVRDSLLANADLRISLRVNNPADSVAVVGSDAAASIPADARGRAVVRRGGDPAAMVQFAMAGPDDAARATRHWTGSATVRRPWQPPLPTLVEGETLPGSSPGIEFGVLDLPQEQRWAVAAWNPVRDGPLLVVGGVGSGKTAALRVLGRGGLVLPTEVDAAWDAVVALTHSLLEAPRERTLAIDDVDALVARFPHDYRSVFIERLSRVLREGRAAGIRSVLSAQRLSGDVQGLAALAPARLWLRHGSRQELVLAGGDSRDFREPLPPGGGSWKGDRVQVAWLPPTAAPAETAAVGRVGAGSLAIVSTRTGWLGAQLRAGSRRVIDLATAPGEIAGLLAGEPTVILGDPDDWQSRWGALAAARATAEILLHACSLADFRALTRSRELPPPLAGDASLCWRWETDGTVSRVRLPGTAER